MQLNRKPARAWQATGRAEQDSRAVESGHRYSSTFEPTALQIWKRNRWCTVAKLTYLDGGNHELILAIVHRNQVGTTSRVSLTLSTIRYAREHGVRCFVFRRDTTGEMFRMPLSEVERCPLGPSVGGLEAERYVEIARMERVPWTDWAWAETVVRLDPLTSERAPEPHREHEGRQLPLWGAT